MHYEIHVKHNEFLEIRLECPEVAQYILIVATYLVHNDVSKYDSV